MAYISSRTIVPGFPKSLQGLQVPGGRYAGALLGLKEMQNIRGQRAKTALEYAKIGSKVGTTEAKEDIQKEKNLITLYNREMDRRNKYNIALMKGEAGGTPIPMIPFNRWVEQENQASSGGEPAPVSLMPQSSERTLSFGQKMLSGAMHGITGAGGFVGRMIGGQQGELATRETIGRILSNIPGVRKALTPRTELGATEPSGATGGTSDITEQFLIEMDTYDNEDDLIQDMKDLDARYEAAGQDIQDVIDLDKVAEKLVQKFGQGALEKLRRAAL